MKDQRIKKIIITILCVLLLCSSILACELKNKKNTVTIKKILVVIAPENFYTDELFFVIQEFGKNGIAFDIVSTKNGLINGMYFDPTFVKNNPSEGYVIVKNLIKVEKIIKEINPSDYDAIAITGGAGAIQYLWEDKELHSLIQKFNNQKKIIAAICAGPIVLAKAGVLKGIKATCPIDDLKNGAIFVNENIIVDGRFVTANGPLSSQEYGYKIVELLNN